MAFAANAGSTTLVSTSTPVSNATGTAGGGFRFDGGGQAELAKIQFAEGGPLIVNTGAETTLNVGSLEGSGTVQFQSSNQVLSIGNRNLDTTYSGVIGTGAGASSAALTKVGSGALTLTGANTYGGATTINAGTLVLDNADGTAVGDTSRVAFTNAGGTAATLRTLTSETIGSLSGGNASSTVDIAAGKTLTVGGDATTDGSYAGAINANGTGILAKIGAGTQTLTGPMTGGALVANGGTLAIGSGGSLTTNGGAGLATAPAGTPSATLQTAVLVKSGAIFSNAGTITAGNQGVVVEGGTFANTSSITAATQSGVFSRTGPVTVTNSGTISGVNGVDVSLASPATVSITGAGTITGTGGFGIRADAAGGDVTLGTSTAKLGAVSGGTFGITATTSGSGNVLVTTGAGAVTGNTAGGNQAVNVGINAAATGASATGTVSVTTGTGAVSGVSGIIASSAGTNTAATVTVNVGGNITGTSGAGVDATGVGGAVTVNHTAGTIQATSNGIVATSSGSGAIIVSQTGGQINTTATAEGVAGINTQRSTSGTIAVTSKAITSSAEGVRAINFASGDITVATQGNITGGLGAVNASFQGGTSTGNLTVTTAENTILSVTNASFGVIGAARAAAGTGYVQVTNAATITRPSGIGSTAIAVSNDTSGSLNTVDTAVSVTHTGTIMNHFVTGISATGGNAGAVTVASSGAIATRDTGILASNTGSGTVTVSVTGGSVVATGSGSTGVSLLGGNAGNAVTVTGAAKVVGASFGVSATSAVTVTNAGTIASGTYDSATGAITVGGTAGVQLNAGGAVTNQANGLITSAGNAVRSAGAVTIDNSGTIRSTGADAVLTSQTASSTIVNKFGATIEGAFSGVIQVFDQARGATADGTLTVTNSGLIKGINYDGVTQHGPGTLTVTNNGNGVIYGQNAIGSPNGYGVGSDGRGKLTLDNQAGGMIVGRYGVVGSNAADDITNAGTIASGTFAVDGNNNLTNSIVTGGIAGIELRAGGTVINQAGGVIDSGGRGISLGAAGMVENRLGGIIRHTGAANNGDGTGAGIYANGDLTLTNGGMITTAAGGGNDGVTVLGVANITNTGTIQAANAAGIAIAGAGSSIINSGTIQGGTSSLGVNLNNGGTINNQTGGLIAGSLGGITSAGSGSATITNDGTIRATGAGQGIVLQAGGTINNGSETDAALIAAGSGTGVIAYGDAATSIDNYGRIQGTGFSGAGQESGTGAFTLNNIGTKSVVYGTGNLGVFGLGTGALTVNNAGLIVSGGSAAVKADGAANITNSGTIGTGSIDANGYVASTTSSGQAILLNAGGTVTNQAGGVIQGGDRGITSNAALTLTNRGTITGAGTDGVGLTGGASSILNAGTISSSTNYGVAAGGAGATLSVTNATGGTITGGLDNTNTNSYGLGSNGQAMTVNNYGSIGGGAGGITALNDLTLTANLYAGSSTGSILGSGGNDTVTVYTGQVNAAALTTTYADAVTGATSTVMLQKSGTVAAATVNNIDLGTGTNTLNLLGTGDGTGTNGAIGTVGGVIAGTTAVIKDDAGTFVLSGANTYTGTTTIKAGILNIQNDTALGATSAGTSVISGATLQIQGGITVGAEALSLAGTGVGGNGALQNVGGNNIFGGTITLAADARIQSDAGTLTLSNANAVTGAFNLAVGGAGSTAIAGTIATGAHTLTKDGAGTLTLSGASTYSGGTALNAGTLELGKLASAGTGAITFAADAQKLQIDVTGTLANTLTTVGTGDQIDFQALTFTGAQRVYDATNHTLTVTNGVQSNTVRLDGGTTLTNSQFVLSADADGSAIVTIGGGMAPAAPTGTGSVPSTGNAITFDGTRDVTAAKGDILVLSVDPQNFAGGAEQNGNVVLSATNGTTATIANAVLNSDGLPNVFVPQGDFLVGKAGFSITSTKANSILLGVGGGEISDIVDPSLAAGSHFIAGGVGRVDPNDGADAITFGGKGKWAIYANAGDDQVNQDGATTSAFDGASVVNVYGQEGNDLLTLANVANKASVFVGGGAGLDTIAVVNAGATTIFGGEDSTDGADRITFNGVAGAGGTALIFGNGGDDTISVGNTANLDSASSATIYGGFGNDQITASGTKAVISVLGNEGADRITVANTGNTFITGGNQSGDQSLDGADTIAFTGSGNVLIFGNAGGDDISFSLNDSANASTVNIYGGLGNDTITENLTGGAKAASVFIAGGQDADTISATGNGGALTIYGGISSADSADGSDRITIGDGSTGALNVFANGGNDTVSIGALGTDTANAATVYGGGGADSIVIAGQSTGHQALTVFGNDGADTFAITKGSGQTITIADFKASEGDSLKLLGVGGSLQVTSGSFDTLQRALDAAADAANATTVGQSKAAAVTFAGSTYIVIDNAANTAGFQAGDQAIKLTGVTDLVGLAGATTVVGI